ncbi:MAG: PD40 domain-containing protein [Ignavibacteriales bacterium]|nr:PD40 domain-containing protein [Ignavibacteriales bacterium]
MNIAYKLKPALFLFSLLVLLLNPTVLSKPFPDSLTVEKILFANNPASGNLDLYIMNNDGSGTKRIVISLGKECGPSLSPDKKKIAFYRHIDENNWHEFIMNFNGTGIVQLTNGQNTWDGKPAWSPDGSRIIFGRVYPLDNFRSEIWVMNADGSGLHRIGANYATSPSYSPDGLKIVYSGFVIDKFQICTADSNGGTVQVLTTAGTENSEPVYSPDGSKIAFQSNRDGNPEIYIMNADGTNQTRLTNNTDTDADVCFSPDGGYLAYTSMRDGKYDIYTMQINGSNQVKLTTLAGSNIQPQWTNIRVPFPAYLGQAKPDTIPKRFGGSDMVSDGLWWWHGAPIFSPDGSEMFMVKYISTKPSGCMQLYYTKIVHGEWSALQQPGFTSDSCDNSPVYSRD